VVRGIPAIPAGTGMELIATWNRMPYPHVLLAVSPIHSTNALVALQAINHCQV
jgi:hypothetical protein